MSRRPSRTTRRSSRTSKTARRERTPTIIITVAAGGGASGVSQLLQQLGQELQSGNLSAAQQAYNALQLDFPQLGQTSGVLQTAAANGVSVSA